MESTCFVVGNNFALNVGDVRRNEREPFAVGGSSSLRTNIDAVAGVANRSVIASQSRLSHENPAMLQMCRSRQRHAYVRSRSCAADINGDISNWANAVSVSEISVTSNLEMHRHPSGVTIA